MSKELECPKCNSIVTRCLNVVGFCLIISPYIIMILSIKNILNFNCSETVLLIGIFAVYFGFAIMAKVNKWRE